ncbi:MAG: AraC family transcriptional regulator [Gemmatimonadota bacterium]|nr:AraC family transcriptional regulator [Gemmatimonadota bacterium]
MGRDHTLIVVEAWTELAEIIRTHPVDVAIVDPRADGTVRTAELKALMSQYQSLPVVVYTSLTPDTLKATLELAKYGVQHVVLRGFDDEPQRFRELLERQLAYAMGDQVLEQLAEQMAVLPAVLVKAIARLFNAPHAFQSVRDLAMAAGMTRRTLDRWLDKAELAPARTLLMGARLARAYHFMRDPGYLLEDVTKKLGYPTPRLFARQVRDATGLAPSELRRRLDPERFTEQLAALLRRHGGGSRNDDSTRTGAGRR